MSQAFAMHPVHLKRSNTIAGLEKVPVPKPPSFHITQIQTPLAPIRTPSRRTISSFRDFFDPFFRSLHVPGQVIHCKPIFPNPILPRTIRFGRNRLRRRPQSWIVRSLRADNVLSVVSGGVSAGLLFGGVVRIDKGEFAGFTA